MICSCNFGSRKQNIPLQFNSVKLNSTQISSIYINYQFGMSSLEYLHINLIRVEKNGVREDYVHHMINCRNDEDIKLWTYYV